MSAPNVTRWIEAGLLTFRSSLHPQPDPSHHYEDWARFVTTKEYVLSHILGSSLFLMLMGVSAFAAPREGQAYLAGIAGLPDLPASFAGPVFGLLSLLMIGLTFAGNLLLGIAVWRSGVLPRWSGALWAAAAVFMYVLGLVYAMTLGSQSTPPTVPLGALMMVAGAAWMAGHVLWTGERRLTEGLTVG